MSSSLICALWMDRLQQNASFSVYNVTEGSGTPAYQRNMSTATWWENYPILSTVDGLGLLVKLPRLDGQQYVHLALMSVPANGNQLTLQYLTDGAWEVVGISYVADDHVAFTATIPGAHLRQVYRVSLAQTDVKDPPCITCYSANSTSCGKHYTVHSRHVSALICTIVLLETDIALLFISFYLYAFLAYSTRLTTRGYLLQYVSD